MNLKDLADLYEEQFLNTLYKITTDDNIYYLQGHPNNFLHLTGVESSYQFKSASANQFYYDCKNGKHLESPMQLNYPKHTKIMNVIDIKTRNFFRMKNSILSAKTLYHIKNDKHEGLAISEPFNVGKKTKYCTLLFCSDKNDSSLSPMSLQIDQSLDYGVIPESLYKESVLLVEEINPFNDKEQIDKSKELCYNINEFEDGTGSRRP